MSDEQPRRRGRPRNQNKPEKTPKPLGRPSRPELRQSGHNFPIYMPDAVKAWLLKLAADEQRSMGTIVRDLLREAEGRHWVQISVPADQPRPKRLGFTVADNYFNYLGRVRQHLIYDSISELIYERAIWPAFEAAQQTQAASNTDQLLPLSASC